METATFLIALGSNKPIGRAILPRAVLAAALIEMDRAPLSLLATSKTIETHPLGAARRRFCNAAALVETALQPTELLAHLKGLERRFGRRGGRRWGDRPLDLDIILWSGGAYVSRRLTIPHSAYRQRLFVLTPAKQIASGWRDPRVGATIGQLCMRAKKPKPVDRRNRRL